MPSRVQSFPQGVRELLGRGDPPQPYIFHPEQLLPYIDIAPFLLLQQRATAGVTEAADTPGTNLAAVVVPDGELWLIHHADSVSETVDADQAVNFHLRARVDSRSFNMPPEDVAASRDGVSIWQTNSSFDLIMRPGDQFQCRIIAITVGAAGSIAMTNRVLFSRLGG